MSKYIAAIDLGTSKVSCVVGENTSEGIKVISYCQTPSPKGIVRGEIMNIQNVMDVLKESVGNIEKQTGTPVGEVWVNVGGQTIKCETVSIKKTRGINQDLITRKEIDDIEKEMYRSRVNQGEEILHVVPQYYNIDDRMGETDPVGMDGKQIEAFFRLFICKSSTLNNIRSVINRAELTLQALNLQHFASARAVLGEDEKEIGVAMVDIGAGTTDLVIYQDNIIRHASVIPFGGNSITEDIRKICGLTQKHAEMLKVKVGAAYSYFKEENKKVLVETLEGRPPKEISLKELSRIIEARLREILATIRHEIENAGFGDKIPAGLVITGGCSNIPLLTRLAEKVLDIDVRVAQPGVYLSNNSVDSIFRPEASTAVGLVLLGFDRMNNPDYLDEKIESSDNSGYKSTLFAEDEIKESDEKKKEEKKREQVKEKSGKKEKKDKNTSGMNFNKILSGLFGENDNDA